MRSFTEFKTDAERFVGDPSIAGLRLGLKLLTEPGLQCSMLMRLQAAAERRCRPHLARFIHLVNLRVTGAEIGSPCNVGLGFVAKHPLGIVIGGGARIGANCTILGKVTLGELNPDDPDASARIYPSVGSNCLLGTGAIILGGIKIGDNAKVGANSVVLQDVPDHSTVVGSPARPVPR